MNATRRPRHDRSAAHRGLTMIEVIVASAMLVGLASVVFGALTFMDAAQSQHRHRLAATEVAHRVIAQYLDNPDLLPDPKLPVQQGDTLYRFAFREEVLVADEQEIGSLKKRRAVKKQDMIAEEQLPAMLNRLTVEVYFDDPRDPANTGRPLATLRRVFNPISGHEEVVMKRLLELVDQAQREQATRDRDSARQRDEARRRGQGGAPR